MDFTELKIICDQEKAEMLTAEISMLGFDSFIETEDGINAYSAEEVDKDEVKQILVKYAVDNIDFAWGEIAKKNWNAEWESNYDPIRIGDKCLVRADFHPTENLPYELIINPKMSFGTGHHATTFNMLSAQIDLNHKGKRVMDCGTGTGVLAIMASKLGAAEIEANDIDDWAVESAIENAEVNAAPNIKFYKGTIGELNLSSKFDIVLANINKNVLLDELKEYTRLLNSDGIVLLSGFYSEDIVDIEKTAKELGLEVEGTKTKDNWACLSLRHKNQIG